MKVARATFLMGLAALASCAESSPTSVTRLVLDGSIEEAIAKCLSAEIARHPKGSVVLEVRSTGGDALAAMELGDAMLRQDVAMSIKQYCHSACSAYLMTSAASVQIDGKASIAFHGTPSWIALANDAPLDAKALFTKFRRIEERFFSKRGMDYKSWHWIQHHKRPFCWFENRAFPRGSPDRYGIASRIDIIAPSRDVMEQLGISNLKGAVPSSSKEAWEFAIQSGFRPSITVAFVGSIAVPEDWTIPTFDHCDDMTMRHILNR